MPSTGLAHLKLDRVKRRKGARGKENAKRRRNTWIVTTRAIPTVMLQEVLCSMTVFNGNDMICIYPVLFMFSNLSFSSVEYL